MAFGQASGPPAPARRVAELAELLEERGFESFREARHPFGLTQRQAAGKFTSPEVDELIDRLLAEADAEADAGADGPRTKRRRWASTATSWPPNWSTAGGVASPRNERHGARGSMVTALRGQ